MQALRSTRRTAFVGVWVVLLLVGCSNPDFLNQLDDLLGSLGSLSESEVLGALAASVAEDATGGVQTEQTADDEEENFGEDGTLYAGEPDDVDMTVAEATDGLALPEEDDPPVGGRIVGRFWNDVAEATSDNSGGVFRGRWFATDGTPRGLVRGDYHPLPRAALPDGIRGGGVFHGKYVDDEGHFRGFLHGRYGHAGDGRGIFVGRWLDRHNRLLGALRGHWGDEPGTGGGKFAGWWVKFELCNEVDSLPDFEFEAGDFGGFEATDEELNLDQLEQNPPPTRPRDLQGGLQDLINGAVAVDPDGTGIAEESDVQEQDGEWPPCIDPNMPFGFLRGWHVPNLPEEGEERPDGGWFHGHWRTANFRVIGALFGRYERFEDPDDGDDGGENENVARESESPDETGAENGRGPRLLGKFYGKYVDRQGHFRGFIRGVYGVGYHGVGVFRGHYYDANGEEKGVLFGRWDKHPHWPGGPFFGLWAGVDLEEEPGGGQ